MTCVEIFYSALFPYEKAPLFAMTQKVRKLVISDSKTTCVEIFYSARFPYEKAALFAMTQKVRELLISASKMTCVEISTVRFSLTEKRHF